MFSKVTIRSVSSEVYVALLNLLKGHRVPKKERTPTVIAAYHIKLRLIASYATVMNPLSGLQEERVLIESYGNSTNKKILLKKEEVTSCIKAYNNKYKGMGSPKLYNSISKVFTGVSEREIQTYINSLQTNQQLHPKLINKQSLKPVTSHGVMDQVQMDLVDMQNSPVENNGKTF